MRLLCLPLFLTCLAGAADLESEGWRRQEQNGAVAYFQGDDAMLLILPPKSFSGDLRSAYGRARQQFLGGKLVMETPIEERNGGFYSEYQVQESNGTRTFRASLGYSEGGQFKSVLYAANNEGSYRRFYAKAMEFFAAHGGGGGQAQAVPQGVPQSVPQGGLAGALVGEWYTGRVSTIQYADRNTGVAAPASGNNMTYKFNADGSYQQYGLMQFTYSTCTNSYFMNLSGRWELRGDQLRTTPTEGTFDSRTCGGQPVRKPANKVESVYQVRLNGTELTMTDPKGASSTYRRK